MSILYVASVSISDDVKDVSPKVFQALKEADVIIGEERKFALRLIKASKTECSELYLLNEHTKEEERFSLVNLVVSSEVSVFFSDSGTPCISDPDYKFIADCRRRGIIVKSIPGASSITAAISVSGINASTFIFLGFPPRLSFDRANFFTNLETTKITAVFMERPYALAATLSDMMGMDRPISISLNLGGENEETYNDTPKNLLEKLKDVKAPFVVVVPAFAKALKNRKFSKR